MRLWYFHFLFNIGEPRFVIGSVATVWDVLCYVIFVGDMTFVTVFTNVRFHSLSKPDSCVVGALVKLNVLHALCLKKKLLLSFLCIDEK